MNDWAERAENEIFEMVQEAGGEFPAMAIALYALMEYVDDYMESVPRGATPTYEQLMDFAGGVIMMGAKARILLTLFTDRTKGNDRKDVTA